ncbi:MAG: tRNA pseudouridine(38-40) synthase TruA [Puniceicoccales bacterium]|jgi:tRNA pseudouridine38-40 synthase|nr:tRNA pseudouridine(38-40) synthase TruA [Puniceicoccales bacterium]
MEGLCRWKCLCAYDGTDYNGWQSQIGGNTIQDFIERRLSEVFNERIRVHGAGRTDAGVHARGQVFHFDGNWPHGADKLFRALRCGFPRTIQIRHIQRVDGSFHARFSAAGKCYIYRLYLGFADPFSHRYCWNLRSAAPDLAAMAAAAHLFRGKHSFQAFAKKRGEEHEETFIRTIYRSELRRCGKKITYITEGEGYLYKMVRRMVGALVDIGRETRSLDDLITALNSGTGNFQAAPAAGLTLNRVFYWSDAQKP